MHEVSLFFSSYLGLYYPQRGAALQSAETLLLPEISSKRQEMVAGVGFEEFVGDVHKVSLFFPS